MKNNVACAVCHGQCGMGEQQTHTNNGLICVCLFFFAACSEMLGWPLVVG